MVALPGSHLWAGKTGCGLEGGRKKGSGPGDVTRKLTRGRRHSQGEEPFGKAL